MSAENGFEVLIDGINVVFPFQPYPIQVDYMRSVINCCQQAENGLLESPTGTGKTFSLLCSTLAWLREERKKNSPPPKKTDQPLEYDPTAAAAAAAFQNDKTPRFRVIYTARTHKQIAQSMQELKKTVYGHCELIAICLASRDQYCVNPDVNCQQSLTIKNQMCRERQRPKSYNDTSDLRSCGYFLPKNSETIYRKHSNVIGSLLTPFSDDADKKGGVVDIEELVSRGKELTICPYFTARYVANSREAETEEVAADIVFAPYNYLFMDNMVNLNHAVVIFDEGHNIESICESSCSANITTFTLSICVTGLNQLVNDLRNKNNPVLMIALQNGQFRFLDCDFLQPIIDFADGFSKGMKSEYQPRHERSGPDGQIIKCCKPDMKWFTDLVFVKLAKDVTPTKSCPLGSKSAVFTEVDKFMAEYSYRIFSSNQKDMTNLFVSAMNDLAKLLSIVFFEWSEDSSDLKTVMNNVQQDFRVAITECRSDGIPGYEFDLFCLSPSVAIRKLKRSGVRSIIITSGTLSPLSPFESELGIIFKHKLSNPHVIAPHQLQVIPVSQFGGTILNGSYRTSNGNLEYWQKLGHTVLNSVMNIPKGVIVFFKSYEVMNRSLDYWSKQMVTQDKTLMQLMEQRKELYLEPKDKNKLSRVLIDYKAAIDTGKGAVLFAVFRGKISEGLDVANDHCRGVISIGLPYPHLKDPHVELKRDFLHQKERNAFSKPRTPDSPSVLSQDTWYRNQMLRAVNQAVGRIVRHRNDYGVVILIDSSYKPNLKSLSAWLHPFIQNIDRVDTVALKKFFQINGNWKPIMQQPLQPVRLPQQRPPVIDLTSSPEVTNGTKRDHSGNAISNPLAYFLDQNQEGLKKILAKEKLSLLVAAVRLFKNQKDPLKFRSQITKVFMGKTTHEISVFVKGISLMLEEKDRDDFLYSFGIFDNH